MKIDSIEISVFELPMYRSTIRSMETETESGPPWLGASASSGLVNVQIIRVRTDEGVDGICTVVDWRYTDVHPQQLGQLRQ